MATPTFYYAGQLIADATIELSADESMHASKSRRLSSGTPVQIINGDGYLASGLLNIASKRQVLVGLHEVNKAPDRATQITIATAIPKGDRQKVMVDMLTQLGVSRIIPLVCEFSATKFKPAMLQKWQRVAIEACKQSQNPWMPSIEPVMTLEQCLSQAKQTVLFAEQGGELMWQIDLTDKNDIIVLIGPEGGFSPTEKNRLLSSQATPVSLALSILRTEAACIAAAAQLQITVT